MARRIEPGADPLDEVRRFYDSLAPDYDLMTSFDARFAKERPWFEAIVSKFAIRSALDAGCGTGFHAILLSQLGVSVTGVDTSSAMVELAARNARRLGVSITTARGSFADIAGIARIPGIAPSPFDAVFCLGNSLVHLLTDDALDEALRNLSSVLRPGGVLIIQVLNYERILSRREELLGVKEAGGVKFERRYRFSDNSIEFTLSRAGRDLDGWDVGRKDSVTLRPLTRIALSKRLGRRRFIGYEWYGSLDMDEFIPEISVDMVVIARSTPTPL
jgi:glycine/sarcosine N-methyltransferase